VTADIVRAGFDEHGLRNISEAARLVAAGQLVVFPTETVYGIACNAGDADALARLTALKERPPDKPYTLHVGRLDDVEARVDAIPPQARKLMRRYWPGPLTIVFPGADGKGVGVRMPSNRVALELIRRANVPVYAPSANRAGQQPATTAAQAARAVGDGVALVLDGGPSRYRLASTVLRVTDGGWEILRQGSVTPAMIRQTLGTTVVLVCTANSCRSPMAEAICKQMLAAKLGCEVEELPEHGYTICSAGTAALFDLPASQNAVEAMRREGIDITGHHSQPITPALAEDADAIYVMSRHHAESITALLPEVGDKVHMLDPTGADVRDPIGGSVEVFVRCAQTIRRHLREVIEKI
jgi:protein-tyrosine phosphatase